MKQLGKIGLIIGVISAGDRKVYNSPSAEQWVGNYFDPRNYLNKISNNDNSMFVDFICYGDGVALYVVLRRIDGRPEDAVIGMITIPVNVAISGSELETVINQIKEELAKTEYDRKAMDELFDKEYGLKQDVSACYNSYKCERFAYQKYGNSVDYQLYELLDKNLFSTYYNSFKAVFLIDNEDDIVPRADVIELHQEQVENYAVVKYPVECKYRLFIKDAEFVSDHPTKCGSIVDVTVEREGYQSQKISVVVDSPCVDIASNIAELEWKRIVKKKWFTIVDDESREQLTGAVIKFDDEEIEHETFISEVNLQKAVVSIESIGYESCKFKFADIISELDSKGKVERGLKKLPKTYTYVIENSKGHSPITFSIKNVSYDVNLSPLELYEVSGNVPMLNEEKIYLRKKSSVNAKNIVVAVVVVLVACALVGWGVYSLCPPKNEQSKHQNEEAGFERKLGKSIVELLECIDKKNYLLIEERYVFIKDNLNYKSVKSKLNGDNGGGAATNGRDENIKCIKKLLQEKTWKREDFEEFHYEFLYDSLNTYAFQAVMDECDKILKVSELSNGNDYESLRFTLDAMQGASFQKGNDSAFVKEGSIALNTYRTKINPGKYRKENKKNGSVKENKLGPCKEK